MQWHRTLVMKMVIWTRKIAVGPIDMGNCEPPDQIVNESLRPAEIFGSIRDKIPKCQKWINFNFIKPLRHHLIDNFQHHNWAI